jgi:hypothetical protein
LALVFSCMSQETHIAIIISTGELHIITQHQRSVFTQFTTCALDNSRRERKPCVCVARVRVSSVPTPDSRLPNIYHALLHVSHYTIKYSTVAFIMIFVHVTDRRPGVAACIAVTKTCFHTSCRCRQVGKLRKRAKLTTSFPVLEQKLAYVCHASGASKSRQSRRRRRLFPYTPHVAFFAKTYTHVWLGETFLFLCVSFFTVLA